MRDNNIQRVTDNVLCTACGACASVCPRDAIELSETPAGFLAAIVDENKCIHCGICLSVCPSNSDNALPLPAGIDPFHGVCMSGYVGHASDDEIRRKSQSGGIATALLAYLLDTQRIDGAIVNYFNPVSQRPGVKIARTRAELLTGCGSYYCQTSVVKEVMAHKDEKLAAVVLGCQAEGLMLIQEKIKGLSANPFLIGLVCAGQNSSRMLENLAKQAGAPASQRLTAFRFKDKENGGWPGNVTLVTEVGKPYSLDQRYRHALKKFYEAYRCMLCFDQMNAFADIVCGDPWGIEEHQPPQGKTVVIARSERGISFLKEAQEAGYLEMAALDTGRIIQGQTVDGRHKTKFCTAKKVCQKNNWPWPYHESIEVKSTSYEKTLKVRLRHSRSFYLAKTVAEADRITQKKRKKIDRRRALHSLIRPVVLALRAAKKSLG